MGPATAVPGCARIPYEVGDGIYESSEGRERLGRRFWSVDGETVTNIDRADVVEALQ